MKTRLIVAAVLLPVLLIVLLLLPTIVTTVVLALASALAAYELLWSTGLVRMLRPMIYTAALAFLTVLWCYFGMDYTSAVLGILAFTVLLTAEMLISHGKIPFDQLCVCYFGGLVIPLLWSALVRLLMDGYGRFYVLLPFVIAFMSDSAAYFAGRFFGKHKLAPVISPNKTIEGVVGGVLGAILGMLLYCVILDLGFGFTANYMYASAYGILGALAGTFGDLVFSAIKRQTGIKDYGNLLPGHGGILDRLDSMTIVAPLVEVLLATLPVVVK